MNKYLLSLPLLLSSMHILALPDDKEQEVQVEALSSDLFFDEDKIIYYGSAENPAVITQGSMRIEGLVITLINENGEPKTITSTGSPARFQQQPEINKALIHGMGNTIVFDNTEQLLTINENAELIQESNILRGFYVEYDMVARKASAKSNGEDDRVNMVIQPGND